jgi:DNA-binding NtrC family response regulator
MRQRQVLVCESDGRLADVLRETVQAHGWRLSEVRHPRVCLGLLPQGPGSVFVIRCGRDLLREMTLVHEVTTLLPETATVVVCDADNPAVVSLAWDLGAKFVLHPPQIRELLPDIVAGFMAGAASPQSQTPDP